MIKKITAIASMAIFLTGVALPALAAGPSENASCMGHEAAAISPPGSSDEIPDGMPGLKKFINDTFPGTPLGQIYKFIASLHEGSHEACDEALD